jgi:hypothetical protein
MRNKLDNSEENMIELRPHLAQVSLPGESLCPPEEIDAALAKGRTALEQPTKNLDVADGAPLLLSETQMQQQQQ